MKTVEFSPIPGTRGYITDNGVELVITHGNMDTLRKLCTVTNKSAVFQLRQTQKALAFYEGKLKAVNDEMGEGSRQGIRLEEVIETKHAEIKKLKSELKKEFWADHECGGLSLPAGFWWMCEHIDGDTHLNTEVPYTPLPIIDEKKPREYQIEVTQALLRYKRASCVLPTGTGKSLCIAQMAWSLVQSGKRVCIIEPTIELVDQTFTFLKKYFPKCAALGGNFKFKPGCDVLVSTIDSAMKHIDIFDAVLVDEFHHSAASTYNDTLFMALSAKQFYGYTACATRADGMSLGIHAACGPVVYEKDTKWAIDNGFLVKPKIVMVEIGGLGSWNKNSKHVQVYKSAMKSKKVIKAILDLIAQSLDKGKTTMVLYKTVMAGQEGAKASKTHAVEEFSVASSQFRNPLREFRAGKKRLLVSNSALCGEGVDIPSCDAVINCTQNSSENMTRQILGRGLRISPGKVDLVFVDIVIMGYEPFERAAQARLKIYETITDNIKFLRL